MVLQPVQDVVRIVRGEVVADEVAAPPRMKERASS
jgi:hypothetical protein